MTFTAAKCAEYPSGRKRLCAGEYYNLELRHGENITVWHFCNSAKSSISSILGQRKGDRICVFKGNGICSVGEHEQSPTLPPFNCTCVFCSRTSAARLFCGDSMNLRRAFVNTDTECQ